MYGILPCGSKACVELQGVPIFLDVLERDASLVKNMAMVNFIKYESSSVSQFGLHGFQTKPAEYTRFTFTKNLFDRKKLIDCINKYNTGKLPEERIVTAADDQAGTGYYVRVIARQYRFMTAGWNVLEKGRYAVSSMPLCDYKFVINVRDFIKLKKVRRAAIIEKIPLVGAVLDKDNTIQGSWDIETNTKNKFHAIPTKTDKDFVIFMVNTTYSWFHSARPFLKICCVDMPSQAIKGNIVVHCKTEKEVLRAHMRIFSRICPEILIAFHGSNFDWPLFLAKVEHHKLTGELRECMDAQNISPGDRANGLKYCFTKEKMKIAADGNDHEMDSVSRCLGFLDIDIRPIFMKLYPKAEGNNASSLNFYLAQNKLSSKEDMPYKRLFMVHDRAQLLNKAPRECHCGSPCECCNDVQRLIDCVKTGPGEDLVDYSTKLHPDLCAADGVTPLCCACGKRPRNFVDMGLVAYYCTVDCIRPQELMVKRNIIFDRRGLANKSSTLLYDAVYRADGMKVKNFIAGLAFRLNIACSMAASWRNKDQKEHFAGGHVFPPKRGLNNEDPTTGLDFASLYPSLMMAYNLSPDMIVTDPVYAESLRAQGYVLEPIGPLDYEIGEEKGAVANKKCTISGWTVRHCGIHKASDTHVVERYEKKVEVTGANGKLTYTSTPTPHRPVSAAPTDWVADMRANGVDPAVIDDLGPVKDAVSRMVPVYGRAKLPGERMGIFPCLVKKLFDKRVPIKRLFVYLCEAKADMVKRGASTCKVTIGGVERELTADELDFQIVIVQCEQLSIKILANTFYGVSGDYKNYVYSLLVAAGITSKGRMNIRDKVYPFVVSKGFEVGYGDTDSLYIHAPKHIFEKIKAEYDAKMEEIKARFAGAKCLDAPVDPIDVEYKTARIAAREEYWTGKVALTMKVMKNLVVDVAEFLMLDNGTLFLSMAYEEVGFPYYSCGKKKYFLVAHLKDINFHPAFEDLMIKGVESVKQGQAVLTKRAANIFMQTVLSPEFESDPLVLALDLIKRAYETKADPEDLKLSAQYKPNKDNVPVKTFVARMTNISKAYADAGDIYRAELYAPPDPGDKFEYLMVKKRQEYDPRGRMIELKKGDRMEFVRVYLASQDPTSGIERMEIDMDHYISKPICGIFARYIAYDKRFQHPTITATDDATYKIVDDYSINEASIFLKNYIISICGNQKAVNRAIGRGHQAMYRAVAAAFGDSRIKSTHNGAHKAIYDRAIEEIRGAIPTSGLGAALVSALEKKGINILQMAASYKPSSPMMIHRNMYLDRTENAAIDVLRKTTEIIAAATERRKSIFEAEALRLRNTGEPMEIAGSIVAKAELNDEEQEAIKCFDDAKMRLMAVMMCRSEICGIVEALQMYRSKISVQKKMNVSAHIAAQEDAASIAAELSFEYQFR
jgi:DNA polymerase elongation subunit (family B)